MGRAAPAIRVGVVCTTGVLSLCRALPGAATFFCQNAMNATDTLEATRSQRLKAATRDSHGALDKRIMAGEIFADRGRFARFLRVQYRFHRDIDGLYANAALDALLPDGRTPAAAAGHARPARSGTDPAGPGPTEAGPGPAAVRRIGLVVRGRRLQLGGTILYKMAAQLGWMRTSAPATAAHPDGAARHWREFTAALDSVVLTGAEEQQMIDAADAAFRSVHDHVELEFA